MDVDLEIWTESRLPKRVTLEGDRAAIGRSSSNEIALDVSDATVKFHLGNLYHKFSIFESGQGRRSRLANEALKRGAVSQADLRSTVVGRPQQAR